MLLHPKNGFHWLTWHFDLWKFRLQAVPWAKCPS